MTGHSFDEIGHLMMSDVFNLVTKYSKTNVFADLLGSSTVKKGISFVLGKGQLSSNMARSLKIVMGAWRDNKVIADKHCYIDKLKYKTYEEDGNGHVRGDLVIENGKPVPRSVQLIDTSDSKESDYAQAFVKGSDFRKNIFDLIGRLENAQGDIDPEQLRLDIIRLQVLIDHVYYELSELKKRTKHYWDEEGEYDYDENYDEGGYEGEEEDLNDDPSDDEENEERLNSEDFGQDANLKLSLKEMRDLYRYLTQYLMPKNLALKAILGIEEEAD